MILDREVSKKSFAILQKNQHWWQSHCILFMTRFIFLKIHTINSTLVVCKAESLCYKRTKTFFSAISCQYNMHACFFTQCLLFPQRVTLCLHVYYKSIECWTMLFQMCYLMCCSSSSRLLKAGLVGPPPFLSEVKLLRVQQPFNSVISAGLFNKDFSFQHNLQFKIQELL